MPPLKTPLGHDIEYRGMTGRDEDILTNKKKVQSGEAINEVLANCVLSIDGKDKVSIVDIDKLKEPDRRALLLAIRKASFGSVMEIELQCTNENCRTKFAADFDLEQLEEVPLPEGYDEATGFDVALSDGTTVRFDYMDGVAERKLMREKNELVTQSMLLRIKQVSGQHANDLKRWLKDLPSGLRTELRAEMEKRECGPNPTVSVDCTACGEEHSLVVQTQASFFFPAK